MPTLKPARTVWRQRIATTRGEPVTFIHLDGKCGHKRNRAAKRTETKAAVQLPLITPSAIFSAGGGSANVAKADRSATRTHAMATMRKNRSIAVSNGLAAALSLDGVHHVLQRDALRVQQNSFLEAIKRLPVNRGRSMTLFLNATFLRVCFSKAARAMRSNIVLAIRGPSFAAAADG